MATPSMGAAAARTRKKGKVTAPMWRFFTSRYNNGVKVCKCKKCGKVLKATGSNTTGTRKKSNSSTKISIKTLAIVIKANIASNSRQD